MQKNTIYSYNCIHKMCMSSRGSQQDLREGSPDRSTLGRKQRFVFDCLEYILMTITLMHPIIIFW